MPNSSLISRSYFRRFVLSLWLLTLPLFARADALDGAVFMLGLLAAVAGIAAFGIVLIVLAYYRSQSRILQLLNGGLTGASLLIGGLWAKVFSSTSTSFFYDVNPFLDFVFPLAAWLGSVNLARREERHVYRLCWLGVAVFAAQLLLAPILHLALRSALGAQLDLNGGGATMIRWAANMLLSFGIWWMVITQVQRWRPLQCNQPRQMLVAPTLEAGISFLYSFLSVWLTLGPDVRITDPGQFIISLLGYGVLSWALGVWVMWLNQKQQAKAPAEPTDY